MDKAGVPELAAFRRALRAFHAFSEHTCAAHGLTAQHYQALLALEADAGGQPMSVKGLAQCLLIKHNSAVGLVDRMAQLGLVAREPSQVDRRSVVVAMTPQGRRMLKTLAAMHRRELRRIAPDFMRHFRRFAQE